ncbi:MAG TPA: allophanate hydrolase [Stellaceae bacterium]|nr:allophanate hydrolase [Stellaceae bacterium]
MAKPWCSLDITTLSASYAAGTRPADVIRECHARIILDRSKAVWLSIKPLDDVLSALAASERLLAQGVLQPLLGIPFAVKDCIDAAGLPTTAACPAFSYVPTKTAAVVQKLEAAGAILLGKTNLDQFATGLNGTRSPYGIPASVFDARYISGGSSSGSAVAVANGSVSFALGTDTAGSGRVPAAFNNIVGLKPTRGWLSTSGLVPACRSLDCVSILSGTVEDTLMVTQVAAGFDPENPFSRREPDGIPTAFPADRFRFGVPDSRLDFFGDGEAEALYEASVARLTGLGGVKVAIDFAPFRDAGLLLYSGPWTAERLAAIKDFANAHPESLHPVTREIILGAARLSAVDVFEGIYRLAALARQTERAWTAIDVMLLPTAGTIYRIAEMLADPVRLNNNLGLYTNFVNLLDLAAVAIPAGFRGDGLPFGVTLIARAFQEEALARIASRLHRALQGATIGATGRALPLPDITREK